MFCPNCGAAYDESEAKCPYCGTLNPRGAQKEYMEKLRRIGKETGELAEEAEEAVRAETRRNSRRVFRAVLIAAAAAFVIFVIARMVGYQEEKAALKRLREEAAFEQQYFPEMNRFYEERDIEGLLSFLDAHAEEPGFGAVYSWKHYAYCEYFEAYYRLKEVWEDIRGGERTADIYTIAAYDALYLTRMEERRQNLTEAEKQELKECEVFAEEVLEEMLQTDKAGIDAFYESLLDEYRILDYDKLRKAMRERVKD